MKNVLLLGVVALFSACSPSVKESPQQAQFKAAIEQKSVMLGMTADQVKQAWGNPKDLVFAKTAGGADTEWRYEDGRVAFFENGNLLVAFRQTDQAVKPAGGE